MGSISSDDCKAFLEKNFHYPAKEWKRVSKKKDEQGRVVREFVHPLVGSVLLAEVPTGLVNAMASVGAPTLPAQLGPWDIVRQEFDPVDLEHAKRIFDAAVDHESVTLDTSAYGYHAMPGMFSFAFMSSAGDQDNVTETINAAKDPNGIVTGLTVFITARHRDYGCNHLSWAVKPFLPGYFEEVEESMFALYARWAHVYDDERQEAVDKGTIPQVRLMDVMRDLSRRGFHYAPEHCEFAKLMKKGNEYRA